MDKNTENEMVELYASKLFSVKDIGARYGVPHQRVTAIGTRVEMERRNARSRAFRAEHGLKEGPLPDDLRWAHHWAWMTTEERGHSLVENLKSDRP